MLNHFHELLRIRNFILLSLAGAMSQLGDRLSHMLLITIIGVSAPGKLIAYSGGALTFVLPTLLLSPIAGVLVDHWDKRKTIARIHFIQTGLFLLVPPVIILTRSFLPFWIALTIFFGLDIFNNTANPALLPHLVPENRLLVANSVNLIFARIATVMGMVIGGFLIKWVGWSGGILIDASCHFVAGLLALNIAFQKVPITTLVTASSDKNSISLRVKLGKALRQFLADLIELIRLLLHSRLVAFVLASIVISTFISAVSYTILIFLVQQVLNMGTSGVGIFAGIVAVGMILGAVTIGLLPPDVNRPLIVVTVTLLYGILFLIGYWLIVIWFMIIVALVAGIAFSWLGVVQNTMLQEEVPAGIRGRIFSTREFFTNLTFLLTTLFIGVLGDITSYRTVILAIGIALILLAVIGSLWIRELIAKKLPADN